MNDLLEAIKIFLKYGNPHNPTHCEHDVMQVDIDPDNVSDEDVDKLEDLGFSVDSDEYCFRSYRFGSC